MWREITEILIRLRGLKVENCHVRTLIGHRGTNWKRRRWQPESETKTCLFRVLYWRCTTTATRVILHHLWLTVAQGQDSLRLAWKTVYKYIYIFKKKICSINCRCFESVCSFRCFKMHFSLCLCVLLQSTRALIVTIKSLITPRPHLSSTGAISCAPPSRCTTSGLIGNHGADGESGQKKKKKIGFKREFCANVNASVIFVLREIYIFQ